jgi:AcrR family transcriptional regulator
MSVSAMPPTIPSAASARTHNGARERLLDAALAEFDERGALGASLQDIRRTAGVSVGALYHHFPDKTHLAAALYAELMERFQDGFLAELRANPDAERGVKSGVRFYVRWVGENPAAASFLLQGRPADDPRLVELNRRFLGEARGWWDTHVHYGRLRALPLELVHALWLGPAHEYMRHRLARHGGRVPPRVATALADAAWGALKEDS